LPVGEFPPNVDSSGTYSREGLTQKILVVGAGGLGCEILKDLGMLQIVREVTVIDLGTSVLHVRLAMECDV
jgi:pyruvate/2-oxoglutarate dehydrogenase complex dihydrolipoamide dehydrogenase (E3) component